MTNGMGHKDGHAQENGYMGHGGVNKGVCAGTALGGTGLKVWCGL